MANTTNDQATGFTDCIANGIPAQAFRQTIESKNVLTQKGSIYVGKGETRKTVIENVEYESYITEALDPPVIPGTYILRCVVASDGKATLSWVKQS